MFPGHPLMRIRRNKHIIVNTELSSHTTTITTYLAVKLGGKLEMHGTHGPSFYELRASYTLHRCLQYLGFYITKHPQ